MFKALASVGGVLLSLGGAGSAAGAVFTYTAVATYDAPSNANAVDANATGNALTSTAATDVAGFTTDVAAAFTAGRGGVIDFEGTGLVTIGTSDSLAFSYAGGAKTLSATVNRASRTAEYGSATAISGSRQFDLPDATDGAQTFVLNFGAITGGAAGEAVTSVGFTALSRNSTPSTVGMSVTFSDGSTSTALSRALAGTAATNDTFYGFVAPEGLGITSLTVSRTARMPFDDLGFITSVVPEPATASVVATAVGALLLRRRRALA